VKRKKAYIEHPEVAKFIQGQPESIQDEYVDLVDRLQADGFLVRPHAEKVEPGLFAMRIRRGGNVRVFYAYDDGETIYGLHAYEKKSQSIPSAALRLARQRARQIRGVP